MNLPKCPFYALVPVLFVTLMFLTTKQSKAQYGFDTVQVYFEIGKSDLNEPATNILDSLINQVNKYGNMLMIFGYADYLGSESISDRLSEKRAQVVYDYLLTNQLSEKYIFQYSGVGQINIRGEETLGNQIYRRVDVFVKRKIPESTKSDNTHHNQNTDSSASTIKTTTPELQNVIHAKPNDLIVLKNINFYDSRSTITEDSWPQLEELLHIMKKYPGLRIRLEGHICCLKDRPDAFDLDENNYHLSVNRAQKIYLYLIEKGIDKQRMEYAGFGRRRPLIMHEQSESDAKTNRRVEVRILSIDADVE